MEPRIEAHFVAPRELSPVCPPDSQPYDLTSVYFVDRLYIDEIDVVVMRGRPGLRRRIS